MCLSLNLKAGYGNFKVNHKVLPYFLFQWVGSVDLNENSEADTNIVVPRDADLVQQETDVLKSVSSALSGDKLDAIICVAGGWAGGNAKKGNLREYI